MPKRKCNDEDDITTKLRKIEKMLNECKSRRKRIISSSSESSSQSQHDQNGEENLNLLRDDTDIDSILLPYAQQENITTPPAVPTAIHASTVETVPSTSRAVPAPVLPTSRAVPAPVPSTSRAVPDSVPCTSQKSPPPSTSQDVIVPPTAQKDRSNPEDDMVPSENLIEESGLNDDILELLGDDPTVTVQYGKDIRPELAARFNHIATNGMNKDVRKDLCEKYLLPGNCTMIGAPSLNTEVKVALTETTLKRDKLIEYRQKRMAAAISCLGEAISYALDKKEKDNAQIKRLMDTARLICDAQYNDSVSRRNLAVSSLKKEMKDPLLNTKIDLSLFGDNLSDSLKTAKAVTKSATELKNQFKPTQSKNWKTTAASRRQPATTGPAGRRYTPAAPTTPAQPAPPPAAEPRAARAPSSRKPPPPPPRFTRRRY